MYMWVALNDTVSSPYCMLLSDRMIDYQLTGKEAIVA